jgi:hypothetical protein
MKEKFLIFIALFVLVVALVALNAASYVQQEKLPDSEMAPNRSTYNIGSTGTRAFYDLLNETGRNVTRWQEPPSALLKYDVNSPGTFVIIGNTQREFEESEIADILTWVRSGGRLVLIDRGQAEFSNELSKDFLKTNTAWKVFYEKAEMPNFMDDPANQKLMTESIVAAKPVQPTIYTENVNAVQPSKFASSIGIIWDDSDVNNANTENTRGEPTKIIAQPSDGANTDEDYDEDAPPPSIASETAETPIIKSDQGIFTKQANEDDDSFGTPTPTPESVKESEQITAPVVHLMSEGKNLLVEFPYGDGQMVFLTDPYIVSNGGINLVDNAQIGINLLASYTGIIAFDEYHQGYGKNNNRVLAYFEGTPLVAFALQLFVLIGFVFYTQSRRFARALPADEPDRLSKLEYVAAMAQLQQRTKSFDLAVENIYKDFRRRASRLIGVDNFTVSRSDLAKLISERIKRSADDVDKVMFKCEDIIYGEPTNKKEVIDLISRLREIENELGLRRGKLVR